jgi:hypothetical protein
MSDQGALAAGTGAPLAPVRSAVAGVGGLPTLREEVSPATSHVAGPSPAITPAAAEDASAAASLGMTGALESGNGARPALGVPGATAAGLGRSPSVAAPEVVAEEIPWRGAGGEGADDKEEVETASVAGSAPGALDAGDMDAQMVDMLDVVGKCDMRLAMRRRLTRGQTQRYRL